MKIRLRMSPDADDRFMVRAIVRREVDLRGLDFEIDHADTERLNQAATEADPPEVCAVSFGAWPAIADRYQLLPHAGSYGDGYGPVLIVRAGGPLLADLHQRPVAIPGRRTTAWRLVRQALAEHGAEPTIVEIPITPPERTFDALRRGDVDAALIIHEGRLVFEALGFEQRLDIGAWWGAHQGLPLPLGATAIRADLPGDVRAAVSGVLKASIAHGLAHRAEAIAELVAMGGILGTPALMDRYLGMYANARTLDPGEDGRAAVVRLMQVIGAPPPVFAAD